MVASPDKADISASTDAIAEYVKQRGGNFPIRKVLIANNGMAATKSILSMRQWAYMELGDEKAIKFVAMATPEDLNANAEFIRLGEWGVGRSLLGDPLGTNCLFGRMHSGPFVDLWPSYHLWDATVVLEGRGMSYAPWYAFVVANA